MPAIASLLVTAHLDAGTMSLYGYVSSKEDVIDLALDAVTAEIERVDPDSTARSFSRPSAPCSAMCTVRCRGERLALLDPRPQPGIAAPPQAQEYLARQADLYPTLARHAQLDNADFDGGFDLGLKILDGIRGHLAVARPDQRAPRGGARS